MTTRTEQLAAHARELATRAAARNARNAGANAPTDQDRREAGGSELDDINADLMGTGRVRSAFGRDAQPGDELSGVILAATRFHRRNTAGRRLYWNDGRPGTTITARPVQDTVITIQTDLEVDDTDDGVRKLYLDRQIRRPFQTMIRNAGATGIAIGARIDRFRLDQVDDNGDRHYTPGTYTPTAQEQQ